MQCALPGEGLTQDLQPVLDYICRGGPERWPLYAEGLTKEWTVCGLSRLFKQE